MPQHHTNVFTFNAFKLIHRTKSDIKYILGKRNLYDSESEIWRFRKEIFTTTEGFRIQGIYIYPSIILSVQIPSIFLSLYLTIYLYIFPTSPLNGTHYGFFLLFCF